MEKEKGTTGHWSEEKYIPCLHDNVKMNPNIRYNYNQ